jgi:demethylmenaquinone methyltransferase / 2-methoxy-6-polyprenyl-1,4-benzoquinol methylase
MAISKPLQPIFEAIPQRYDLINHIFTLGMDSGWRRKAAKMCVANHPLRFLDLGCGTGDLTLDVARFSDNTLVQVGLDFSRPMLEKAKIKIKELSLVKNINFVEGNAGSLPFHDGVFDSVGIAFAFRNLVYKNNLAQLHFKEVYRVLTGNGRYVIIESSQPESKILLALDHFYLKYLVFWLGYLISRNKVAYRYLVNSALDFYSAKQIREMLIHAGFKEVVQIPLFFGAVCIHIAQK